MYLLVRWYLGSGQGFPTGGKGAFLVSGRDLARQQEVSSGLTKTPPIRYYNVVDSAFSNYAG